MSPLEWTERIIVCGTKEYNDFKFITEKLDRLTVKFTNMCVISGGQAGFDILAERWAFDNWWSVRRHHPDYERGRTKAFIRRNTEMVGEATRLVAFLLTEPDDILKDLIRKARRKKLPTKVYQVEKKA